MNTSSLYIKRKTADQSVANSTVLVNDTDLLLPIDANTSYIIRLVILFNLAGVLSGYKFGLTGPASPSNLIYSAEVRNLVATGLVSASALTGLGAMLNGALATSGNHLLVAEGLIENGANAGNLTLQFAQNTSDASAITVKRGSIIILTPLN